MAGAFILVTCLCLGLANSHIKSKQFRTDYEYNEKTDAFYKLHIESLPRFMARSSCAAEDSALLLPASDEDVIQVHRMFKLFPDIGEYAWVTDDGVEHESAEEPATISLDPSEEESVPVDLHCNVITRDGDVQSTYCVQSLPFVCKVAARAVQYNKECDVYTKGYQRAPNVSSCYKIPTVAYAWNQAYADCVSEGAHLVVLNSQAEHDFVHDLMNNSPSVAGTQASWFFHAGFRAQPTTDGTPKVFKTIFNQTLEEAGYSTWADNEPNNAKNNENCGTLFKNDGKLNDADCSRVYGFICEKEIAV